MFIYMSKKIAIPKQSNVTCISWNHSSGYIAVGGEDGMLKVLKLESGGGGNLSMNLSLEGHTGQVCVAIWNEVFQKLTTSDEHGVIIVWMLYKGSWYEEMINNRNKSTVRSMAWGSDGQKICIAYEDGAVIVGSVDGSRVWGKDIKGPGLAAVQWSPDNSQLLFALTNGELHIYDDQGNFTMPVAINGVSGSMDIVTMDWYSGSAPANRPVLAISYKSGIILLMKNCNEEDSVVVESNMSIIDCHGTITAPFLLLPALLRTRRMWCNSLVHTERNILYLFLAKSVNMPVVYVTINSKAIVVAASKESFLIWKFSTPTRPRATEQLYQADGSPVSSSDTGFQDDTICCIASSDTHLLIGRDSGSILLFSLVNFKKITSINMNSRPYRLGLNSNSSKFYVIDQPGSLYLLETDMANNISIGQALRKDVWSALWATDNPQMLAVAEKARLYVMRDTEPEEPLTMQGYLCKFKELEITSALLDNVDDKCTPQHIVKVEVKSLRDTRQLIEKVGLKEAENFIKDNPHPQLWSSALEYYTMSNNTEGLKKCYMALEDNESLSKLFTTSPRKLANLEASKKASPLKIKKLYVLAGHLYSQSSVDGSRGREAARCWRGARAAHWAAAGAARARARPVRPEPAARAAARLMQHHTALHPAMHTQVECYVVWCTIASIAIQTRAFELCSKALIKLEAQDPETFENLAIEIFTRYKPKNTKGNKIECPNCDCSMPEWSASCPRCSSEFPECAVSGRGLGAGQAVWTCAICAAHAQHHELVLRHSCPMCHAQLT
nr:unnamed protein product [Spodoptera littoralis]